MIQMTFCSAYKGSPHSYRTTKTLSIQFPCNNISNETSCLRFVYQVISQQRAKSTTEILHWIFLVPRAKCRWPWCKNLWQDSPPDKTRLLHAFLEQWSHLVFTPTIQTKRQPKLLKIQQHHPKWMHKALWIWSQTNQPLFGKQLYKGSPANRNECLRFV